MLITDRASRRLKCLLCDRPVQRGEFKVSEISSTKTIASYHEQCFLERIEEIIRINNMGERLNVNLSFKKYNV
jgi:hypothetical protein